MPENFNELHIVEFPDEPLFHFTVHEGNLNHWIGRYLEAHPHASFDTVLKAVTHEMAGQLRGLSVCDVVLQDMTREAIDYERFYRVGRSAEC
jgi:hypothetical protein